MTQTRPVASLRRPRLLSRAAREGARRYDRDRDLARILPSLATARRAGEIVAGLLTAEAECEAAPSRRRDGLLGHASCAGAGRSGGGGDAAAGQTGARRLAARPEDQMKLSGSAALRRATKSASASPIPGSSAGAS